MFLVANRQEEVLSRASNRKVCAHIQMIGPEEARNAGTIIESSRPAYNLTSEVAFQQHAHVWLQEDTCEPLVAKDPELLAKVVKFIGDRTKDIDTGKYALLHSQERKRLFNSDDAIDRANGIPTHSTLKFNPLGGGVNEIRSVPFKDLQDFLFHLSAKLGAVGGRIDTVDITHSAAQSAFDYYEIATHRYGTGRVQTLGDIMLATAFNMLTDGHPRILPDDFGKDEKPPKKKSGLELKH